MDINVKQRLKAGNIYGFVPDSQGLRTIIIFAMMVISVSQLLSRALGYALIAVSVSKSYATIAVLFEVVLFFTYKLVRRDLYYHTLPNTSGIMRVIASCFQRFTIKIIVDFTSLVVLANPCELGGLYFR
jgi:hypothetical protein